MVLGQPVGYIKLWSSLAKPWRRLWGKLSYLGPQDYLPPNPKRAGPIIPPGWDISCWNRDASAAAEDYTNAQAASDAGATPVASGIGTAPLTSSISTGRTLTSPIATATFFKRFSISVAIANPG
jgi:hypothetical protein